MKQWTFIALCSAVLIGIIAVAIHWQYQREQWVTNVKVRQDKGKVVELSGGKIRILVGEIEEQAEVAVYRVKDSSELVKRRKMSQGEEVFFTLGDFSYKLQVVKVKDHKIIPDSVHLKIWQKE